VHSAWRVHPATFFIGADAAAQSDDLILAGCEFHVHPSVTLLDGNGVKGSKGDSALDSLAFPLLLSLGRNGFAKGGIVGQSSIVWPSKQH
jgi:hypothetical protein